MTTNEIILRANALRSAAFTLTSEVKNAALSAMAEALSENESRILSENALDVEDAKGTVSDVMLDRLRLNSDRIRAMADGILAVRDLDDPVGRVLTEKERPNGLNIKKISVPCGVIAIIYESRPNVTSDAAALAFKSGNIVILRSGRQAHRSASAITEALRSALIKTGLSPDFISLVEDTSRESAMELMTAVGKIDLLIPRGGASLIRSCVENAKVPCVETGTGICHVYVDESADIDMALNIVENAKTSRPSVCNAEEVLLVAESIADKFLPLIKKRLADDRKAAGKQPVELRLDEKAAKIIDGVRASDDDFDTEFLDYILAVKVVKDVFAAIEHIAQHSTHHSEAIVTESSRNAELFTAMVDSAAVYVNASTRFTDGGEFGLGCEMGISTQKLHARGPMGLNELCSYKYVINGNGNVR